MAIEYRFDTGGYLEQQDPDGAWAIHQLQGAEKTFYDDKVGIWLPLALENEARTGMPAVITLAVMYGEGAKPNYRSFDNGLGLMQITSHNLKQGLSDEEVMVPENNVRLGVDALTTSASKVGYDPVKLASMYNAGGDSGPHPSASGPWGVREYTLPDGSHPYISKVVRAYNYGIDYVAENAPEGASGSSVMAMIGKVLGGAALLGVAAFVGVSLGARR